MRHPVWTWCLVFSVFTSSAISISTTGKHGAVASEVGECSKIGVQILKEGGNAADAVGLWCRGCPISNNAPWYLSTLIQIIASALCVGTISAYHSGIGGGGFMLWLPSLFNSTTYKLMMSCRVRFNTGNHSHDYEMVGVQTSRCITLDRFEIRTDWFPRNYASRRKRNYVPELLRPHRVHNRRTSSRSSGRVERLGAITQTSWEASLEKLV
jgi:hypothetical protein